MLQHDKYRVLLTAGPQRIRACEVTLYQRVCEAIKKIDRFQSV